MQDDLAVFKACSDATRLRILFLVSERELCVCELVAVLGLPQGKISRHLTVLKHAGLVSGRRNGAWIYYSWRPPDLGLKRHLMAYLKEARCHLPVVVQDLQRLHALAGAGKICAPHPSGVPAAARVTEQVSVQVRANNPCAIRRSGV